MPKGDDQAPARPAGTVTVYLHPDAPYETFLDSGTHLRVTRERQAVAVELVGEGCRRAGWVIVED